MIPRLVLVWWLALVPPAPDPNASLVSAEASETCRSIGLARAESAWTCGRDLDAQCGALGLERVNEISYSSTHCSDDAELVTCSITCSVECSPRATE